MVFDFEKLRQYCNLIITHSATSWGGVLAQQIFSINYGIVEYVDREMYIINQPRVANPIQYTYIKDKKYEHDKELRISLSALGVCHFALNDSEILQFSQSLQVDFDFRKAFAEGIIKEVLLNPENCDAALKNLLMEEMKQLGFSLGGTAV